MTNTFSLTTESRLMKPAIATILLAWLVAGTLDITYAIITWGPVFGKITAAQLLQSIASVLLGKSAFAGGISTALLGLAMHYGISLAWTLLYFFIFPFIPFFARNKAMTALFYGIFVWAMMTLVILPLLGRPFHFQLASFLKSIAPMIILFAPAIVLIVNRYYFTKNIPPL